MKTAAAPAPKPEIEIHLDLLNLRVDLTRDQARELLISLWEQLGRPGRQGLGTVGLGSVDIPAAPLP